MVRASLNQILKKKTWTGDEVGRAIILDLCDSYRRSLEGDKDPQPLFSPEKLTLMVSSLTKRSDGIRYNRYVGLQSWLQRTQPIAQYFALRLQYEIAQLNTMLNISTDIDEESIKAEQHPLIMTQKQYDEYRAARIEELLKENDGRIFPIGSLILMAFVDHMAKLENEPAKANPLKAIRKAYQKQRLTTDYVRKGYPIAADLGYWTFPDGTSSLDMTEEETSAKLKQYDEDEPEDHEAQINAFTNSAVEDFLAAIREHSADAEDQPAPEEQPKQKPADGPEWHEITEAPEETTKWEALSSCSPYELFFDVDEPEAEDYMEQAEALAAEFPELVAAMLADIAKHYKSLGITADMPVKEWAEHTFTYRQLYELNFYGMKDALEEERNIFSGNVRALVFGVAIIKDKTPSGFTPRWITEETGHYHDPAPSNEYNTIGFGRFTPENPDYVENMEEIEGARQRIEASLKFALGFDAGVQLITDFLNIPEFVIFKINAEGLKEKVDAFNKYVAVAYRKLDIPTNPHRETTTEALRDLYYPIKIKELETPPEALAKAQELLDDNMKAFELENAVFISALTEWEGGVTE
jgi:hypothetical protein